MELVKEIIVNLAKNVQRAREGGGRFVWTEVPVDHFLRKEQMYAAVSMILLVPDFSGGEEGDGTSSWIIYDCLIGEWATSAAVYIVVRHS